MIYKIRRKRQSAPKKRITLFQVGRVRCINAVKGLEQDMRVLVAVNRADKQLLQIVYIYLYIFAANNSIIYYYIFSLIASRALFSIRLTCA